MRYTINMASGNKSVVWYLQRCWFILFNQALAYFPESQKFNKESNLHIQELFQELVFIHIHISEKLCI